MSAAQDPRDSGAGRLSSFEQALRDERAHRYDADYQLLHGRWFPLAEFAIFRRLLSLKIEDVLLDFGSGTGRLAIGFASRCKRVIAFDESEASLAVLEERARDLKCNNIQTVHADVTKPISSLPLVDKLLSVQLLQHIPSTINRRTAIQNAFNALVSGGRAVFVDEIHGV